MKKILLSALAVATIFLNSCTDDLLDVKFGITLATVNFTLPAQTQAGSYDLEPTLVTLNLDSIADANGVDLSKFKSVKVKSCNIKIVSPGGANFDPLQSAVAFFRDPASGQATGKRIASIDNIPDGVNEVNLIVVDENILDMIKVPFEVFANVTTTEPIGQAVGMEARIELEVVANPTN